MPTCVHGDVCRAWMMSDRTRGNAPLVCSCPNGCKFFEAKFSNRHVIVKPSRYVCDDFDPIDSISLPDSFREIENE